MNKNALKIFAIESRKELIEKIQIKAMEYGISKDKIKNSRTVGSDSIVINGKPLSKAEKQQREKLIEKIRSINEEGGDGYKQIIEEVAYTWFNRFTALRFMEVNNYLPTKVRALSSATEGNVEPELIKEASNVDLPVDKQKIYEMKLNSDMEGLFKYMIIAQCNSLNKILPYMFQEIGHYTELLLPNGLLNEGAFVRRITDTKSILESDWEDVEVIGWLYQYYISEKKDEVFADLRRNIKITKENIPSATQLFTPDWIVKYMVENSLGRLWLESHPDEELKAKWKYYLEEAEQGKEVQKQLEEIRNKNINPEEIKVFDCCMGSGHILVYFFEVLYDIYKSSGYTEREIPKLILTKNIYGLDIDDRASQLAYFAVMMKARSYNSRIFSERIDLNICSIQESNGFPEEAIEFLVNSKETEIEKRIHREDVEYLINVFNDAKEYGSILKVKEIDFDAIELRIEEIRNGNITDIFELQYRNIILEKMPVLVKQGMIMNSKYNVVVTNPPYMGNKGMTAKLAEYTKRKYPDSKTDMFSVFIEKCREYTKIKGYQALIVQPSLLFLGSFDKLRYKIIREQTIVSLLHMGRGIFGVDFGSTSFILKNYNIGNYNGSYFRLNERTFQYINPEDIEKLYLNAKKDKEYRFNFSSYITNEEGIDTENEIKSNKELRIYYETIHNNLLKILGFPIAYWLSDKMFDTFNKTVIGDVLTTREGMATADNNQFLRLWYEICYEKIVFNCKCINEALKQNAKWFPYNKGGEYRKWSGNEEYIVNWYNDGYDIKNNIDNSTGRIRSHNYNGDYSFQTGITWSAISAGNISVRFSNEGFLFDSKGAKGFCDNKEHLLYILALINSKVGTDYLKIFSTTLDFKVGHIIQIPLILGELKRVNELVEINIDIAKNEWNSFETSWGFKLHPLLKFIIEDEKCTIQQSLEMCKEFTQNQFEQIKDNEEELNRIFIDIYEIQDEMTPEVEEKYVTIRKSDREREIKSFISYSVGCMFGRYSLDQEGLIYAGEKFDSSKYIAFKADEDNIIPILSDRYFEDDIVSKLVDFVKVTFGEETLPKNLEYVADTLGKKGNETAKEAIRRYFINNFYKDHLQTYKKRPIYWMFTSGKQKAFNCLINMHRYDKTTLSRIRTDYVHELQDRLDNEKKALLDVIEGNYSTKEKSKATNKLSSLDKQIEELKKYDEVLHHMADMQIEIDLDDGVVVNYEKFKGLLAKI